MSIGANLYDYLENICGARMMSITELANACGLGEATLYKWRDGTTPTKATLNKVAAYLGYSVDELINAARTPISAVAYGTLPNIQAADLSAALVIIREQQAQLNKANDRLLDEIEAQRVSFDKKWADLSKLAAAMRYDISEDGKKIPILATI